MRESSSCFFGIVGVDFWGPLNEGPFGFVAPLNKVLARFFRAFSSGVIIGFFGFYCFSGPGGITMGLIYGTSISTFWGFFSSKGFLWLNKDILLLLEWERRLNFLCFIRSESKLLAKCLLCCNFMILFSTLQFRIGNKTTQKW